MTEATSIEQNQILPRLQENGVPEAAARLMAAALELFADKGYAATSVREIVQRADVTNPMLYYYFDNKEGLFFELVEHLFESFQSELRQALAEAQTFRDKLEALAWTHIRTSRENPLVLRFVYSVIFGPRESRPEFDIFGRQLSMFVEIMAMFEQAIDEEVFVPTGDFDAHFLVDQFFGMLHHHVMWALGLADTIERDDLRAQYCAEMLNREASDRMVNFFLTGAGVIRGPEASGTSESSRESESPRENES